MASGGWWDRLVERFEAWDREVAGQTLAHFEAHYGVDVPTRGKVGVGDLATVRRAVTPEGRPLLVHHWATWCAPCMEELVVIETLARRLDGRADVIGVSWERFQDDREPERVLAHVAQVADQHDLSWGSVVFDGEPERLFGGLGLVQHTVPQTHLLDADGGTLRRWDGPLEPADVDTVLSLVG